MRRRASWSRASRYRLVRSTHAIRRWRSCRSSSSEGGYPTASGGPDRLGEPRVVAQRRQVSVVERLVGERRTLVDRDAEMLERGVRLAQLRLSAGEVELDTADARVGHSPAPARWLTCGSGDGQTPTQ
jgi:hypothetical protein